MDLHGESIAHYSATPPTPACSASKRIWTGSSAPSPPNTPTARAPTKRASQARAPAKEEPPHDTRRNQPARYTPATPRRPARGPRQGRRNHRRRDLEYPPGTLGPPGRPPTAAPTARPTPCAISTPASPHSPKSADTFDRDNAALHTSFHEQQRALLRLSTRVEQIERELHPPQ